MSPWKKFATVTCAALAMLTTNAFALSGGQAVVDPLEIEGQYENTLPLLDKIISTPDEVERYLSLASYIKTYGPWVELSANGQRVRIHIITYLLQQDKQRDAVTLVKSKDVPGWLSYRFQSGVANDFLFAMDTGKFDYVLGLISEAPEGVNGTFPVTIDGDVISPLALLATEKYRDNAQYELIVRSLLKAGANPYHALPNGLSPMVIAASANNVRFSRIVNAFDGEQKGTASELFKNTPLNDTELVEMQAIADALIERQSSGQDNYSFEKLHQLWVKMILKGYNIPADLIYEKLIGYEQFSVDYREGEKGITGLMAAVLSSVYGGNVEYANRLIERGADPKVLIDVGADENGNQTRINLIQLALQSDNYKIVALLIQNGVNFILIPDNEEVLILSAAMEQRAFKSAYVIREAINSSFSKIKEGQ